MQDQHRLVQRSPQKLSITADSSDFAWGGTRGSNTVGGPWIQQERAWHINAKELMAVLLTLRMHITGTFRLV